MAAGSGDWFLRRVSAPTITLTPESARRFMIHAVRLAEPHADIGAALDYHGYVQIDPINMCGRMHDLILRNRVAGYREGGLMNHLYAERRTAIEAHHPVLGVLSAFNMADWPLLAVAMRRRAARPKSSYYGRFKTAELPVAEMILSEIERNGPMNPGNFEPGPRLRSDWGGNSTLVRKVFEKLFMHGRLVICRRDSFRRVYDLPERVVSADLLSAPAPSREEHDRWAVLSVIRQRRLVTLRRKDVVPLRDDVVEVKVEGCSTMFSLRSDIPLLEQAAAGTLSESDGTPRLLAPLDPLIYDRKITSGLWDFDYTWEVYTPEAKRKRGYYALPILADGWLVGHVDPKADRKAGRLRVMSRKAPRGVKIAPAVAELAGFLRLK